MRSVLKDNSSRLDLALRLLDPLLIAATGYVAHRVYLGAWDPPARYVTAMVVAALLGFAALDAVVRPALSALGAASGVVGVAGRASAEAGTGAGVVLRAVAGRIVSGAGSAAALWVLLLAAGVVLLLRLVSGYHRASARD